MNWLAQIPPQLRDLLVNEPLVLVDVGASGAPPHAWRELAPLATYVGFDPDLRELHESNDYGFRRFIMVDKAITSRSGDTVDFNLTASPHCSSVLTPNVDALSRYSFTELFDVVRTASVQSTTMRAALEAAGISRIDWLKLDTQGTDLDIIESLDPELHDGLLAVDIEPGVDEFYVAENTFTQAHDRLMSRGFWLADARFQRYPRLSLETRRWLASHGQPVDHTLIPGNPTAVEALYYRTLEHLEKTASARDLVCAWMIAMLGAHYGSALDVAVAFVTAQPDDPAGKWLVDTAVAQAESGPEARSLRTRRAAYKWTPEALRPLAQRLRSAFRRR